MDEFVVKSSRDDCTLTFCNRQPDDRSEPIDRFEVEVTRCDLSARASVWAGYTASHPAEWFHEVARSWPGWKDEIVWSSLEGELTLAASHDRFGHITIRIELRPSYGRSWEHDWSLKAFVVAEAGQLETLAKHAARFFERDGILR